MKKLKEYTEKDRIVNLESGMLFFFFTFSAYIIVVNPNLNLNLKIFFAFFFTFTAALFMNNLFVMIYFISRLWGEKTDEFLKKYSDRILFFVKIGGVIIAGLIAKSLLGYDWKIFAGTIILGWLINLIPKK